MLPHNLRPNTNPPTPRFKPDIRKYCPPPPHTYIRISLALLSPRFRLCSCNYCREIFHSCGRALTFQVTNAHPGTQSKSFAPKVDQFEESRFLVINNSASIDGDALSLCVPQWWCKVNTNCVHSTSIFSRFYFLSDCLHIRVVAFLCGEWLRERSFSLCSCCRCSDEKCNL